MSKPGYVATAFLFVAFSTSLFLGWPESRPNQIAAFWIGLPVVTGLLTANWLFSRNLPWPAFGWIALSVGSLGLLPVFNWPEKDRKVKEAMRRVFEGNDP